MTPRNAPRPTRGRRGTDLARRLTAARLEAGLTQAQAAEAIGVALRTLSSWENGANAPRGRLQAAAVEAFIAAHARRRQPRR